VTAREVLTAFGEEGERWVVGFLRRRGYSVEWIGGNTDYDVLIEGCVKAEVKTATLSAGARGLGSGRWQFSLRRNGKLVDEHLLFLVCWLDLDEDPVAVFVIPGRELDEELAKIDITTGNPEAYGGRWSRYYEAWEVVDQVLARVPARKPELFREEIQEEIPF